MVRQGMVVAFACIRADGQAAMLTGECIAAHESTRTVWVSAGSKHYLLNSADVVDMEDDEAYAALEEKFRP